jgi:ribonucleoside-triphosphate reductase
MRVIKRDGSMEDFKPSKIVGAVRLSANRTKHQLTEKQEDYIIGFVLKDLKSRGFNDKVSVDNIHLSVENCLWEISRELYQEYRSYNNYKRRFNYSFNNILREAKNVIFNGDKENANKDSCIISTKMTLVSELVGKELYLEYELPKHLAQAHKDMDFYIHDAGHRFYNGMINCCLFDIGNVLKDGFNLNGKTISEPDSLEKALDLVSDILFVASSQQYGGFTLPELDKVLKVYAEKTYIRLRKEHPSHELAMKELEEIAYKKFKSIQYKIECVNNAGGQMAV